MYTQRIPTTTAESLRRQYLALLRRRQLIDKEYRARVELHQQAIAKLNEKMDDLYRLCKNSKADPSILTPAGSNN